MMLVSNLYSMKNMFNRQKKCLCSCDKIKHFEIGRLFWIIQVGLKRILGILIYKRQQKEIIHTQRKQCEDRSERYLKMLSLKIGVM